jgi:hypothetical protein
MSKKDYEAAALIVQRYPDAGAREMLVAAFSRFFSGDNYRFDCDRFERACIPGANVRARA